MSIEVILQQEVPGLGAEADIVKVKPGYARNFLIPNKMALPATDASKRQIEALKAKRAEREAAVLNEAEATATAISNATVTFQIQVNAETGKTFGSITTANIAERLESLSIQVDRHKIDLDKPLKEPGEHTLKIHLPMGVEAHLKVVLEAKAQEND
jgi:large subunit ribosomal protein L9